MGYLGVDVGGTKVALRVEGGGREPYESSFRWPPAGRAAHDVALLRTHLDTLRQQWGAPLTHVGVAMPATMDPSGRVVTWPGRPSWDGFDLAAALADLVPEASVQCADDGDLAALAEARAVDRPDVLYVGVGTGVGGGLVLQGRSIPGPSRGSVEIGHMIVDRGGPACDCGRTGCLQAVASGPATLRRAELLRGAPVDFAGLLAALGQRQSWAVSSVEESADALAVAVINLSELMHPADAVVGGGFAAGLPGFVQLIAERTTRWARKGHPPPAVRSAVLGGLSSLYGAVLLARSAGDAGGTLAG